MSFRSAAYLAAVMSLAPIGLLAAQQAAAPAATTERAPATGPAEAPAAVTPVPAVPQPQYSPLFQKSDPEPALGTNDNTAVASSGSHTIVLSTLALILVVVILVLLIA